MTFPPGFGEVAERLRRSTVLIGGGRSGTGSGVVVEAGGTIATNAHVVHSPRTSVQLWDGRSLPGTLKARDPVRDLALVTVEASGLPAAPLGDSRSLRPGEIVIAAGNPLGFLGAITVGVVHATGTLRGFGPLDWVQSDVRLAPGNSGGPLASATGGVVGLNAMIAGRLALAVPSEALRRLLAGEGSRDLLGVSVRQVRVSFQGAARTGLLILEIGPETPAEPASLLPGDIIVGTDGSPLESIADLAAALEPRGERVLRVQFLRGDRSHLRNSTILLGSSRSRAA